MLEHSTQSNQFSDALLNRPSIQAGRLEVRFASNVDELKAAQELRYRTLYLESGGQPSEEMLALGREQDQWDYIGAHVVVFDHSKDGAPVVGTLRLVSNLSLAPAQTFYTEQAFDISRLRQRYQKILELSRFCIDPNGRNGSILMLIWKFTLQYILAEKFELMLGCASFQGSNVEQHKPILSYLYQNNLAPSELQSPPVADSHVQISDLLEENTEWDDAKRAVPTLLRGYLKVGAKITDTAIVDPVFNTVFVGIYVDAHDMVVQNHTLIRN